MCFFLQNLPTMNILDLIVYRTLSLNFLPVPPLPPRILVLQSSKLFLFALRLSLAAFLYGVGSLVGCHLLIHMICRLQTLKWIVSNFQWKLCLSICLLSTMLSLMKCFICFEWPYSQETNHFVFRLSSMQ